MQESIWNHPQRNCDFYICHCRACVWEGRDDFLKFLWMQPRGGMTESDETADIWNPCSSSIRFVCIFMHINLLWQVGVSLTFLFSAAKNNTGWYIILIFCLLELQHSTERLGYYNVYKMQTTHPSKLLLMHWRVTEGGICVNERQQKLYCSLFHQAQWNRRHVCHQLSSLVTTGDQTRENCGDMGLRG